MQPAADIGLCMPNQTTVVTTLQRGFTQFKHGLHWRCVAEEYFCFTSHSLSCVHMATLS